MDRLALPDAEMMGDRARLLHARHLLTWASYYLANAGPSRAARDLAIAYESLSQTLTTSDYPSANARQLDIFRPPRSTHP